METENEFRARVRTDICSRLNDKTFDIIYRYAWQEGHAYGYSEVEGYLFELTDLAVNVVKANRISA